MAEDIKTEEHNAQELDAQELDDPELDDVSGGLTIRLDRKPDTTDAGPGTDRGGEGCGSKNLIGGPKYASPFLPRKEERRVYG